MRSVIEDLAVSRRGTSKEVEAKSGEETVEDICSVFIVRKEPLLP